MQAHSPTFNPAEAWLEATISATSTMLSLATKAAEATIGAWTPPVSRAASEKIAASPARTPVSAMVGDAAPQRTPSSEAVFSPFQFWLSGPSALAKAPAEPKPENARERQASPAQMSVFPFALATGSVTTPRERQPARENRQSWYRAPYRSPFDPAFWMMPGHPVDHMQDWLAAMPYAAAAYAAMPSVMRTPHPAMPSLGSPFRLPVAPWTAATDVWLGPWKGWFEAAANSAPTDRSRADSWTTGRSKSSPPADYNVVDFTNAFSVYRTAGGHASAQIIRNSASPARHAFAEPAPTVFDIFRLFLR